MTAHLHLVREKRPDVKDLVMKVYCSACEEEVYIIHLDRPPEDPPEREGQIR